MARCKNCAFFETGEGFGNAARPGSGHCSKWYNFYSPDCLEAIDIPDDGCSIECGDEPCVTNTVGPNFGCVQFVDKGTDAVPSVVLQRQAKLLDKLRREFDDNSFRTNTALETIVAPLLTERRYMAADAIGSLRSIIQKAEVLPHDICSIIWMELAAIDDNSIITPDQLHTAVWAALKRRKERASGG